MAAISTPFIFVKLHLISGKTVLSILYCILYVYCNVTVNPPCNLKIIKILKCKNLIGWECGYFHNLWRIHLRRFRTYWTTCVNFVLSQLFRTITFNITDFTSLPLPQKKEIWIKPGMLANYVTERNVNFKKRSDCLASELSAGLQQTLLPPHE